MLWVWCAGVPKVLLVLRDGVLDVCGTEGVRVVLWGVGR